jgi:hypothetical protein
MSDDPKFWFQPMTTILQDALEGARQHFVSSGNDKHADVASTYISVLGERSYGLRAWHPESEIATQFVHTVDSVAQLYRTQNFRGVLQQSFAILARLPGDPPSDPPDIPRPPGSDDYFAAD